MIILCVTFFAISMKLSAESLNLFSPVFLIVVALLLYVASTLFLYIIASRLSAKEMREYWSINHVSNIITNLIFSVAFFLNRYQKKNPFPEKAAVDFTSFPDDR
jgi:nicotinamide riboside transporter PnuC